MRMAHVTWTIEDNLLALYVALYGDEELPLRTAGIAKLVGHKGFDLRVQNYRWIAEGGKRGLSAGHRWPKANPTYRALYELCRDLPQEKLAVLVSLIIKQRIKIRDR